MVARWVPWTRSAIMRISTWFHPLAAALLVTPAFASPVRTQTLASADTVPEGLSAPEWSSIRQLFISERDSTLPAALKNIFHIYCKVRSSPAV